MGLDFSDQSARACVSAFCFISVFRCPQDDPSTQALEALVISPPRSRRRGTVQGVSASVLTESHPEAAATVNSTSAPAVQGTTGDPIPSPFPAAFLEQLVQKVATEVTQQLQTTVSLPAWELSNPQQLRPPSSASLPAAEATPVQQVATEIPIVGGSATMDPGVNQEVHSFTSSLAGEGPSLQGRTQSWEVFTSINLPVDARVPAKLKAKVWREEFIDLGSLLINHTVEGKYQLTIHNPGEGSSPSLALEPVAKPKKIVTIDTWVQAFHVFVGIYTSRYPSEVPILMKYGATIQNLAARGHNWRFYDENVRFLRQTLATSLPLGTVASISEQF